MRAAEADHRNINDNKEPEEDQETEIYEESEEDPEELIEEEYEEEEIEEEYEEEEEIEEEIYEESDQYSEHVTNSKEHDQENEIDEEAEEEEEEEEEEEIEEESDQDPENQENDPEEDPDEEIVGDPEEEVDEDGKEKKVVEESETKLVTELEPNNSRKKCRKSRWDQSQEPETPQIDGPGTKKRITRWDNEDSSKNILVQRPSFIDLMQISSDIDLLQKSCDPTILTLQMRLMVIDKRLQNPSTEISKNKCKKLLKEGRRIITELTLALKPPVKYIKKVFVPTKEYPNYNFIGLIIGPWGLTQKKMQKESGAKILLRGAGSGTVDTYDEDLHVLVEADSQRSVDHAVALIEKLLIPVSDEINAHKKAQLTELAKLKGSFIDYDVCNLCKEKGHKQIVCPLNESTFNTVGCDICGGLHMTSKCKEKPRKEVDPARLYVGYLSPAVDEKRLKELFLPFGKINETTVIKDHNTGLSKGYGFVKFEDPLEAADAIKYMNGHKMEGKILAVSIAGQKAAPYPVRQAPVRFPAYIPSLAPIIPQIHVNGNMGFSNSSGYSGQIGQNFNVATTGALNVPPPYVVPSVTDPRMGSNYSLGHDLSGKMNSLLPNSVSQFPGDPDYRGSQFKSYFE